MPELEIDCLTKRFAEIAAVDNVSFSLSKGEFLSLIGPSGCGKTTTLRMIAGFVRPDSGNMVFRGRDITQDPPYRRDVGLVFQSYALFPHMTVAENVGFGPRMQRARKAAIAERVKWALDLVRLGEYGSRRPHELSGGQQQRVAVARVLAAGASLLLFDEPFSNLDAKLRKAMQVELRELQLRLGMSTIHVTHDQEEAMTMSDRIIVMNAGRVEQEGSPEEMYRNPASAFVADFMGGGNRLVGRVIQVDAGRGVLELELDTGGRLEVPWKGHPGPARAAAFVRPEHIQVAAPGSRGPAANVLAGTVSRRVYLGAFTILYVSLGGALTIVVQCPNAAEAGPSLAPDSKVDVYIPPSVLRLLPAEDSTR